jgi:hypothetical protein
VKGPGLTIIDELIAAADWFDFLGPDMIAEAVVSALVGAGGYFLGRRRHDG